MGGRPLLMDEMAGTLVYSEAPLQLLCQPT